MTPIKLESGTLDAIAEAQRVLGEAARIDAAIDQADEAVITTKAVHEAAAGELASIEADVLTAIDTSAAKAGEARIRKAEAAEREARTQADRSVRIAAALRLKLVDAELAVQAELAVMQRVAGQHAEDVLVALVREIEEAAVPLKEALRRAGVLNDAVRSRSLGQALSETLLSNPALYQRPIIHGLEVFDGGRAVNLLEGWGDDDRLVDAHAEAIRPRLALEALEKYGTRAERERSAKRMKATATGYSMRGRAGGEDWFARNAAETAAARAEARAPRTKPAPLEDGVVNSRALSDFPEFGGQAIVPVQQ
jgi:hypothetical protein